MWGTGVGVEDAVAYGLTANGSNNGGGMGKVR